MTHIYIIYNQLREKQIIKIKSASKHPCKIRDAEAIEKQSKFIKSNIAYVGVVGSEEDGAGASASSGSGTQGQQRR